MNRYVTKIKLQVSLKANLMCSAFSLLFFFALLWADEAEANGYLVTTAFQKVSLPRLTQRT